MIEAAFIVVVLGALEFLLWWLDRRELREQTELLTEIAVALSLQQAIPQAQQPGQQLGPGLVELCQRCGELVENLAEHECASRCT